MAQTEQSFEEGRPVRSHGSERTPLRSAGPRPQNGNYNSDRGIAKDSMIQTNDILDSLCCNFLFEPFACCCRPLFFFLHRIRWCLARPLQTPVLPRWCCWKAIPGKHITYGQVLLNLPTFFLLPWAFSTCTKTEPVTVNESGGFATLAMWVAFWTANKSNSFASFVYGIPFERMISTHYLAAVVTVILGAFHGYLAYMRWGIPYEIQRDFRNLTDDEEFHKVFNITNYNATTNTTTFVPTIGVRFAHVGAEPNALRFAFDGYINWSGTYLTLAFVILLVSSLFPSLRRKFYNMWFITHILSSVAVLYFGYVHFRISVIIILTWGLDLILRYLLMALCRYPHRAHLSHVTDDIVCISWVRTKWFAYNPGQFVKLSIPALNPVDFHPMSIASAPYEDMVRVYIRGLGKWSRQLDGLVAVREDSAEEQVQEHDDIENGQVRIFLEGPYGSLSVDTINPSIVLCVSGGIGIAPCQSIALSLLHRQRMNPNNNNLMKLRFVWALRELELVDTVLAPELVENYQYCLRHCNNNKKTTCRDDHGLEIDSAADRILETEVYHTRGTSTADGIDFVEKTCTTRIRCGRPDLDAIWTQTKDEAIRYNVSRVPVFCCGPTKMMEQVRDACHEYSTGLCYRGKGGYDKPLGTVIFELHEEVFEM